MTKLSWKATRQLVYERARGCKGIATTAQDTESGNTVPLFNPRQQEWQEHFEWDANFMAKPLLGVPPFNA